MWIGGYLVAPLLFNLLENRQLAGTVAGAMFSALARVGLVCGLALVGLALWQAGHRWLWQWRAWMLGAMLALIVVGAGADRGGRVCAAPFDPGSACPGH
jgi:hypothetical protein